MADASLLTLAIPGHFPVRPDQYLYLWIPYVSTWPLGYPFAIAWWEENKSSLTLFFLAEEKPGFTHRIRKYAGSMTGESLHSRETPCGLPFGRGAITQATDQSSSLLTLFNGPYGLCKDFSEYGTVVAFATGTGIASLLLHIRVLIDGSLNMTVCTRRVVLYWQIDNEGNKASADMSSKC
jgi:NAD(P)H-flavin reductase